jgi:mercuric ion binding protein
MGSLIKITKLYLCYIMKICTSASVIYSIFLFLLMPTGIKAQASPTQIAIKTSVVCEMCTKNIEKALSYKGIEKLNVDLKTKIVTVSFDPQQTNPEQIRSAISKAGYDADDQKANPKAYKKLKKCCKKEEQF